MPADSFTGNLNLRKPEVGAAYDAWGGVAGLNGDLDILDAIFLATGLSTVAPPPGNPLAGVPGVGLRIGKGMVLNIEGQAQFHDATDATKMGLFDTSLIDTATTRTLQFPNENGVIATQVDVAIRCPTGTVLQGYYGGTAPPSFVMADGRTIGDATSGATNRANADTVGLFTLLWNITANAQCPVSGGRGASAAADYAAHKTLALPNHSGRTMAGRDDLSGAAAGVWPGATVRAAVGGVATAGFHLPAIGVNVGQWFGGGGFSGTTVGSQSVNIVSGGESHGTGGVAFGGGGYFADSHTHNINGNTGGEALGFASFGASGGTSAYDGSVSVIQPSIIVDVIIAL
jgi:hypothetical protein